MNITTKYKTTSKGAGRIEVTGTIEGKRHTLTVPYDHSLSRNKRHGRAAAAFVNKYGSMSEARRLATAVATVQASWTDNGNQGFVFTFPDN